MSDYLPNELQSEIFKRLPPKCLGRCTTVCKSWYSLITNPNFISSHFHHTILLNQNDAQTLVLRPLGSKNKIEKNPFVQEDETSLYKFSYLKFPFKTMKPFGANYKTVGNCMGLVCLANDDFNIILWNPSIRKFVEIGLTNMPESTHRVVLGFGFCPTTFDHKIVKIEYGDESTEKIGVPLPPQVEIYALSSRTWKSVRCDLPPCSMIEILWSQAFLNGAIHWVARDRRAPGNNRTTIMSFDLVYEAFHEIDLPKFSIELHRHDPSTDLFLAIYKENLCFLEYVINSRYCRIWVMTEYGVSDSWTQIFFCNLHEVRPMGLGKSGNILLMKKDNNEFALHNPVLGVPLKSVGVMKAISSFYNPVLGVPLKSVGVMNAISSFYADTFMENLLLLNGQSRLGDDRNQIEE